MSVFLDYSKYYDLLYKDKNYKAEAEYVHNLIQQGFPGAKTILNLGCGTGKHDFELVKFGYTIVGVDLSHDMIQLAQEKKITNISFMQGDIRTLRLEKKFDVVISLFHVMCYQTSNEDMDAAFKTAHEHLKDAGVFIFDCWHGPGVLSDLPKVRVKRMENESTKVLRIAEPVIHCDRNVVDVCYELRVRDKNRDSEVILNERHEVRYLFLPEIRMFAGKAGFMFEKAMVWMTQNQEPTLADWFIVSACKKKK